MIYSMSWFRLLCSPYAMVRPSHGPSRFDVFSIHINRFVGIYAALMPFFIHILVYAFFYIQCFLHFAKIFQNSHMQKERTTFPTQYFPSLCYILPIHYVDSILGGESGGTRHKNQRLLHRPTIEGCSRSALRRDMELVWSIKRKWNNNVAKLSILD